jgi:hypothetical protein
MIFPKYLAEPLPSARGTPRFRGTPIKTHCLTPLEATFKRVRVLDWCQQGSKRVNNHLFPVSLSTYVMNHIVHQVCTNVPVALYLHIYVPSTYVST